MRLAIEICNLQNDTDWPKKGAASFVEGNMFTVALLYGCLMLVQGARGCVIRGQCEQWDEGVKNR